ncbi:MAG: prepilin peptidase, partial [Chloroflexi bacterium]|nr:prepilin peptidase [Chloroflexota bacterium]
VPAAYLAAVLLGCAAVDLADRRIPNALTYPAIVLAVLAGAVGEPGLLPALAGGALAGGLWLVGYWRRWNGLGDAKLALLVGLVLGWPGLLRPLAVGLVIAGLVAGALLVARRWSGDPTRYRWLPYGPYLALAGLLGLVGG